MLLMMGVCTRNMSSWEYINKITLLHQVGSSNYFMRKIHGQTTLKKQVEFERKLIRNYCSVSWVSPVEILVRTSTTLLSWWLFRAPPCRCLDNTLTYDRFTSHDFQSPDSHIIRSGIHRACRCLYHKINHRILFKQTVSSYCEKYEYKYENNFLQYTHIYIYIYTHIYIYF